MQLFKDNDTTFATRKAAIAKLERHVDDLANYHWHIAVNEEGRFFPVVSSSRDGVHTDLVFSDICVL